MKIRTFLVLISQRTYTTWSRTERRLISKMQFYWKFTFLILIIAIVTSQSNLQIKVSMAKLPPSRVKAIDQAMTEKTQRRIDDCYLLEHDEQGKLCVTENNCITYTYQIFELHCV